MIVYYMDTFRKLYIPDLTVGRLLWVSIKIVFTFCTFLCRSICVVNLIVVFFNITFCVCRWHTGSCSMHWVWLITFSSIMWLFLRFNWFLFSFIWYSLQTWQSFINSSKSSKIHMLREIKGAFDWPYSGIRILGLLILKSISSVLQQQG